MKGLFVLSIILALSCFAFGATEQNQLLVVRSRRDLMERSVKLIQDLVANLQRAAEEALDAVGKFSAGIVSEAELMRDKILKDIEGLKDRISVAIENVYEKFSNATSSVKDCVDSHRNQAAAVLEETVTKTMGCVDDRIANIGKRIQELKTEANQAISDAAAALENLKNCTQTNNGILNTGSCLTAVATQTEIKSMLFMARSSLLIGNINLSIATLPAALELCAGTRLVQAGIQTGKVVVEIGTCSASAVFTNITG